MGSSKPTKMKRIPSTSSSTTTPCTETPNAFSRYTELESYPHLHSGQKAAAWTITIFEDWPVAKNEPREEYGGGYCWIAPNKGAKLRRILQSFRERKYEDTDDIEKEAERIWHETGYLSTKHVEESDQLLR